MKIRHQQIERVILTGKQAEAQKAFSYCARHGYWILRSGPMPLANYRVDSSRFKIIAERKA